MAGTAALCPEHRHLQAGLELADSYLFNPHKWMFVNFDCDCFWVADRAALVGALGILPEYLKNAASASGAVIDYRDWQVPLGRRFRALKLWMVIRHYGVEGLRHHVREHVAMAHRLRELVAFHPDFDLVAPSPLNLVCFRHRDGDAVNANIMESVNATGALFFTHTRVNGAMVLRLAIGQSETKWSHVEAAWARICAAAEVA
jgi:aromatic-L-amino-acid decarboxylase